MIITEMQHLNDSPQRKNSDATKNGNDASYFHRKLGTLSSCSIPSFSVILFLQSKINLIWYQLLLSGKRQTPWSPTEGRSGRPLSLQYNKHINPFPKGLPLDFERRFQDTVLKCETRCLEELYHSCDLIARVAVHKKYRKRGMSIWN